MNQLKLPLLYAGTYQAEYPRNRLMVEAFRRAGLEVVEINEPVWETATSADDQRVGWFGWSRARLAARFMSAYPRLLWSVGRRLRKASALVIGYPGQFDMLMLAPLARLWRKPVVFNPLVTLTDTLIEDRGLVKAAGTPGWCIRNVDRLSLRLASLILVDTRENGDYIVRHFDVPAKKVAIIPVGADATVFDPSRYPEPPCSVSATDQETPCHCRPGLNARSDNDDPFGVRTAEPQGNTEPRRGSQVVSAGVQAGATPGSLSEQRSRTIARALQILFYGKYIPLHGIETILRAARLLQEQDAPVAFDLIGNGQTYEEMRRLASSLSLTNVAFLDPVSFRELPGRLAAADVVLGIFGETAKASRVVPNKVFQAMAMGSAIVTLRSSAIEAIIRDDESALLVEPGSAGELAGAILELRDERLRLRLGRAARQAYLDQAGPDVMAQQVGHAISDLLQSSGDRPRLLGIGSAR